MKVYIVTTGSYSDYQIQRVLTDKERAEKLVAAWNATSFCGEAEVQEWETDEQSDTLARQWVEGEDELSCYEWTPLGDFEQVYDIDGWTYEGDHPGKATVIEATDRFVRVIGTDEMAVRKTIYDTVTQIRAQAEGIA